jgi:hypothetical protein
LTPSPGQDVQRLLEDVRYPQMHRDAQTP